MVMNKFTERSAKLGINLNTGQLEQFEIYYKELVEWNNKFNLTRITDYKEVRTKHFLDSLTVAAAVPDLIAGKTLTVIDIGTGAGLPGIPLKIVFPNIRLVLLEATAKKTEFLKLLVGMLKIGDIVIIAGRSEELAHDLKYREKFELVLSRAVAALPALVELTLPFATVGGLFVAQKKGDISTETKNSYKAIELLGGKLREVKPVEIDELKDGRSLVIIDKIRPTPPDYPRRPGIPVKKPIR